MSTTRVIIDNHHPKHYLTVRQLAKRCAENNVEVVWAARDKDVLLDLMRADGIEPHVITKAQKGLVRLFGELIRYDWGLYQLARQVRPDALLGVSFAVSHVGIFTSTPSIVINDDDAKANPQYPRLAYPFASRIITPDFLNESYGDKHVTFSGLCELAYLGPNTFVADLGIRKELGIGKTERYSVIRTVALRASHDLGAKGLGTEFIKEIIKRLESRGRVFISAESDIPPDLKSWKLPLHPSRMHHVLASADFLICDSQTMAAEAAVLGVPSLRISSFTGRIRYLQLLEERFNLTYSFSPDQKHNALQRLDALLELSDPREEWAKRRDKMLAEWSDPTEVFWKTLSGLI